MASLARCNAVCYVRGNQEDDGRNSRWQHVKRRPISHRKHGNDNNLAKMQPETHTQKKGTRDLQFPLKRTSTHRNLFQATNETFLLLPALKRKRLTSSRFRFLPPLRMNNHTAKDQQSYRINNNISVASHPYENATKRSRTNKVSSVITDLASLRHLHRLASKLIRTRL